MRNRAIVSMVILSLAVMMLTATPKLNADSRTDVHVASVDVLMGHDCTVDINVTSAADLYAWELQLSYDPALLSVVSASIVPGGLNMPTYTFVSNNTSGHLWWAVSSQYPTLTGTTITEQAIFEIVFHANAPGTCDLHLTGTVLSDSSGNAISHSVTDGTITVKAALGDINGDGKVNMLDAVIVSQAFASTPADPQWNSKADLNGDGRVNVLDASQIGLHWGEP